MSDSFRRSVRFLTVVLLVVLGATLLRRLLSSNAGPAGPASTPRVDHPIRLPDTNSGADIEVETVRGAHVVAGVATSDGPSPKDRGESGGAATSPDDVEPDTTVPWWVPPEGDACPASHPVKVKQASGIYHVPGGINYDRTKPDRCYLSPAAAQNDGYRASKR